MKDRDIDIDMYNIYKEVVVVVVNVELRELILGWTWPLTYILNPILASL